MREFFDKNRVGVIGCCGEVGVRVGGVEGEREGEVAFAEEEDVGGGVDGERVWYWLGGLGVSAYFHGCVLGTYFRGGGRRLEVLCP